MNLFDIILKLIKTLGLVPHEKYTQLKTEVEEYEDTCKVDSDDKIKSMYAKLHKGVLFRLITPFLYFYMLSWVRSLNEPKEEDFLS